MLSALKATLSSVETIKPLLKEARSDTHSNKPDIQNAVEAVEDLRLNDSLEKEALEWQDIIYDIIRTIKDPEKEENLEELNVVQESLVSVTALERSADKFLVTLEFVPTVPHCSLATLIGLCLRTKLNRELPPGRFKIDIKVKEGTHSTSAEITKQINDKERVAAALENPNLVKVVEECIKESDY